MEYLSSLISKWMPEQEDGSQNVAVDSHPRLSGIMDTINSTLAHGPKTRLPSKFYDAKARDIIDRIGVEEYDVAIALTNHMLRLPKVVFRLQRKSRVPSSWNRCLGWRHRLSYVS